jgi:hypothetical protein
MMMAFCNQLRGLPSRLMSASRTHSSDGQRSTLCVDLATNTHACRAFSETKHSAASHQTQFDCLIRTTHTHSLTHSFAGSNHSGLSSASHQLARLLARSLDSNSV